MLGGFHVVKEPPPAGARSHELFQSSDVKSAQGSIRVRVDFSGARPEDARLYAIYVETVN